MRENMKQKYPLLHKTVEILSAGADRVAMLARKVEALPEKIPEIFAFLAYAAAHLGMAAVHEPFFDEEEAAEEDSIEEAPAQEDSKEA